MLVRLPPRCTQCDRTPHFFQNHEGATPDLVPLPRRSGRRSRLRLIDHERVSSRPIQLKAQPGCAESWRACSVSPWVLKTITRGYVLQFARSPPPFSGVIQSVVQQEQSHFLRKEIISLLRKEAISRVPPKEENAGFYSRYFLVPKRDRNYRPILDLRVLNKALMPLRFRMLTPRKLVQFIRPNDWFITIDLKDAYF